MKRHRFTALDWIRPSGRKQIDHTSHAAEDPRSSLFFCGLPQDECAHPLEARFWASGLRTKKDAPATKPESSPPVR